MIDTTVSQHIAIEYAICYDFIVKFNSKFAIKKKTTRFAYMSGEFASI